MGGGGWGGVNMQQFRDGEGVAMFPLVSLLFKV